MAVQLVVLQGSSQAPVTVNLPQTEELGGGESVTADAETATAVAVISSFSSAARSDDRLTEEERGCLQLSPQDATENSEISSATQFGVFFQESGDKIATLVAKVREKSKDFTDNATEDEDPNQAMQTFLDVALTVFEVGEDGLGTFNCGRLIVMFYLGYDLCVSYLKRHGVTLIVQFVELLTSQLIRFLSRTGFFSWLFRTGGWACAVAIAKTDRYFQGLFHGALIVMALYVLPRLIKYFWKSL